MPRMVKVFRKPTHDCPVLGRKVPNTQLIAYREKMVCDCEHCREIIAHFELREGAGEEVPEHR